MGEVSKTSGEDGEKITEELLKLIGWDGLLRGVSVPCIRDSHNRKKPTVMTLFLYTITRFMKTEQMLFVCHQKTTKMVTLEVIKVLELV